MGNNQKSLIADEAARLLAERSDLSIGQAVQKAATRLGFQKSRLLPDDALVEQALRAHQQLFYSQNQPNELRRLRQLALQAMHTFCAFHPRLVGRVNAGTADQHSAIQLHLFCETIEEVIFCLLDNKIPWQEQNKNCSYKNHRKESHPLIVFHAGDTRVNLLVLPLKDRQNPPLSTASVSSEKGMSVSELEQLLI